MSLTNYAQEREYINKLKHIIQVDSKATYQISIEHGICIIVQYLRLNISNISNRFFNNFVPYCRLNYYCCKPSPRSFVETAETAKNRGKILKEAIAIIHKLLSLINFIQC